MKAIEEFRKNYNEKIKFRCANCGFTHIIVSCKDYKPVKEDLT